MASNEICPQQQLRRDCDRQWRGIETPEERRRLERLKQNREIIMNAGGSIYRDQQHDIVALPISTAAN